MKVRYHQHNRPPIEAHVVKDHGDGTVSLSRQAGGEVFVTCILGEKVQAGRATPHTDATAESGEKRTRGGKPPPSPASS